jgi:succinate dehydrogenase / fumarate reductase iron-sulfur subunit
MGNLPIVKDLVVDMTPFWSKFRSVGPWLQPGYEQPPDGKEYLIPPERLNFIHKEALCINCGCCVSSATRWRPTPSFSARRRSRRGCASSATRATLRRERLESLQQRARDLGLHAVLLLQRALPKGVDPRDAMRSSAPSR